MTAEFSLVLDSQCALGESPVWWAYAGVLVFIDITGRRLHRFDPQSGRHEVDAVAEDIGCVAPAQGGGYVAGMRSGVWLLGASGEQRRKLADGPAPSATNRGPPRIPGTRLDVVRESGHLSPIDRPGQLGDAIRACPAIAINTNWTSAMDRA